MEVIRCGFLYVIFSTILTTYAGPCETSYNATQCTYTLSCEDNVYGVNWVEFINYYPNNDEGLCQDSLYYADHHIYPINLILRRNDYSNDELVPALRGGTISALAFMIYALDLSNNEYDNTPVMITMMNLHKLNMSRNHLTTALLSNVHELSLTEIDLSHNEIKDIKVYTDHYPYKKLRNIDLSHNHLEIIPDGIFDVCDDLQTLDLSHNDINILRLSTFEGTRTITDLNLSFNRLKSINSSLFRFSELKILKLSDNNITELKFKDFEQLSKLETLDLSSNSIKTIDFNAFNAMVLLADLDLSNNQLTVVTDNMFSSLVSLNSIDISKNKIESWPKDMFKNANISKFSISGNILRGSLERGMFDRCDLTRLDLSYQHLTEVKDYAFFDLNRLSILLLNSNSIQALSNMCFKLLINLKQLDLSHNQITNIDFDKEDLSNLQSLVLKNNHLIEIKYEQLQHLSSLEYLDLSENLISRLDSNSFHSLRSLINLEIKSNPLVGTLKTGTFDGLVLLPSLDVSQNMLTTVQNASFKDMTKLTELIMSSCEITELQYNTFLNTGSIEILDFSHNKLNEFFVNTTDLVRLTKLFLNNNLIKTISSSTLNGITRLNKIILSHNAIENIYNESFTSMVDLVHLDLSYNEKLNFTVTLERSPDLYTLILSGIKTHVSFAHLAARNLSISNANIRNISELNLGAVVHLYNLNLRYNNMSELKIGDFTGTRTLKGLDLSFNQIKFIQPGVFKDNTEMHSLNISHNCLSSIGYGIFRGLRELSILDVSFNKIEDLENERFYELKSLSQLIVDNNRIAWIDAQQFVGTSLSKLSIGDNLLSCQILVNIKKKHVPFEITAINLDEHNHENVNGVTCNKAPIDYEPTVISDKIGDSSDAITGLRNILYNFTNRNIEQQNSIIQYLEEISNLANLTSKVIAINNNTNIMINNTNMMINNSNTMLNKIVKSLDQTIKLSSVPQTSATPFQNSRVSLARDSFKVSQTVDSNPSTKSIEKTLFENTSGVEKENPDKIKSNLAVDKDKSTSSPYREKFESRNESTKSLFTETCVALILLILVGFVVYKLYKSKIFTRNRFPLRRRVLPVDMENSNL